MRTKVLSAVVGVVVMLAGGWSGAATSASPVLLPPSLFVWEAGEGATRVMREIEYVGSGQSVWDPAGRRVAVTRRGELIIYNVETGRRRVLDIGELNAADPAWAPDGNRIAFSGSTEELGSDIYTIEPGSGDVVRLTDHPRLEEEPEWSPVGDQLAFNRWGISGGLFVMDAGGGNLLQLVGGVRSSIHWAPDGETIAFVASHDIWTIRNDGSEITALTTTARWEGDISWSPSGDRIVHTAAGRLYILDLGTGAKRRLRVGRRMSMSNPDWGRHGKRIAFEGYRGGHDNIWTVRPDGTKLRKLTRKLGDGVSTPIWSPTGALRLIFERSRLVGTGEVPPEA